MAAPTVAGLAATVAALQAQVAALEAWQAQILALAAAREERISSLESYVESNAEKIADLDMSDEASGWKQWRIDQGRSPAPDKKAAT